jgi:hypothetical protein
MKIFENDRGEKIEVDEVPLFATPLIVTKYNDHEKFKFDSFEKADRRPEFWTNPVNTSFPGVEKDDPYISQDICNKVKNSITAHLKSVFQCYNMPSNILLYNFWYNAYYEGQGQEIHNHLAEDNNHPFWCGIYFAKNCFNSQLKFRRNDSSLLLQQPFDYRESALADYYRSHWPSGIPDGYICLFPPHLDHKVTVGEENRDKMRLSFSFNIKYQAINLSRSYR